MMLLIVTTNLDGCTVSDGPTAHGNAGGADDAWIHTEPGSAGIGWFGPAAPLPACASEPEPHVVEFGQWPDSPTPLCHDDYQHVSCADTIGQDGNDRINVPTYMATDATVKDSVTGLEWERNLSPYKYSFEQAERYCCHLDLAGHTDWRLPTRLELVSLLDYGRLGPAMDPEAFPSLPSAAEGSTFWSASRGTNGAIWTVDTVAGETNAIEPEPLVQVRCVRGDRVMGDYIVSESGETVFDTKTGLTWQRHVPEASFFWMDAIDYCENLALDGATDWRLASVKELHTIVDESTTNPAWDTTIFGEIAVETNFCTSSSSIRVYRGIYSGEDFNFATGWRFDFGVGRPGLGFLVYELGRPRCVH